MGALPVWNFQIGKAIYLRGAFMAGIKPNTFVVVNKFDGASTYVVELDSHWVENTTKSAYRTPGDKPGLVVLHDIGG